MQAPLCQSFVEKAIALLKQQNELVANHPNSHVYSQLLSLVDFEGYYLESEPCLVCNDPEVPFTVSGGGSSGEGGRVGMSEGKLFKCRTSIYPFIRNS